MRPSRVLLVLATVLLAIPLFLTPALAATKTVHVPAGWANGSVPWASNRTKESADFILFWGEKSGTDPTTAPSPYNFDPANILSQLESLYGYYVHTMRFTPETGYLTQYKIDVVISQTWNDTSINAWASGGEADGVVGVITIAPGAALPGSWGLAHELGHVFQNYAWMDQPGFGLTDPSAGTFWETSAEYMAMQVYPDTAAGDLTRFLRTENLYWSSSRHHYGNWMLMQYIVDNHGGIPTFNRIWNEGNTTEHPLEAYRRITGISQAQLGAQVGAYAQHQVTYDYSNRAHFMPFVNSLYPFVTAYNGVWVDPVDQSAGHYTIPDSIAPSDFGYNKIRLVPASDGALIRLHFKGHVNSATQSGWTYGFVAVKNGVPRYGALSQSADGQVSFQLQPGENEVYLVVAATPGTVHHYAYLDGYTKDYRYPYEFRVDGAYPSGYEPGYTRPAAPAGGHWASNGGGWVDNRATVAATAYVAPHAAVYGNATVTGNARIEDLAWVNSGGTVSGNAVVKDNALIQGGVSIGGSAVVGGDAEPTGTCDAGTYLLFNPDRGCDGGAGESDINPSHGTFTNDELAITGTSPSPSPTPTTSTSPTPPATGATCTAAYQLVNAWSGGFQAQVTVTAGPAALTAWKATWTLYGGQAVTQAWNATVTTSGSTATATNASYNGALAAGASTSFGFTGTYTSANPVPTVSCTGTG
jgi:hypothetical protein